MGKVTEEGAGRTENGKGISGKECREDCWEKCRERFLGDRQENRQERVPGGQSGEKQTGRLPKGLPESFSGDRQEDRQENRRERVPGGLPGENSRES